MPKPIPPAVPDQVRRFILTSVPSVPFLEAALLFHASPDRAFSISSLAHALYVPVDVAQRLLDELTAIGVVTERAGGHGYSPRDTELADALDQLFACYRSNLVEVTRLIHDPTLRSAERFANAFRWRKDSDNV
ncbi:hypothetical protein LRS03_08355 [Rhizobacter sp. J219]|uniref:hypothetical protein n=1 Tax=Rhizobacter sp. J219 TaxID=2898430 RepID=UPI002151C6D0|nr:hypothetical protein [Rhizobacter sp. J219]MCR5882865.1 hypothetical protein [Rhizobacter sp. J219]